MSINGKTLCGYETPFCRDLLREIEMTDRMGYAFLTVPLFHPRYRRDYTGHKLCGRTLPDTRSDSVLQELNGETSRFLVGRLSPRLNVDSPIPAERRNAEITMLAELRWAAHLGVPAVLLKLHGYNCSNLARLLTTFLKEERYPFQVWVQVPAWRQTALGALEVQDEGEGCIEPPTESPWHWWSNLTSTAATAVSHLHAVLEMSEDLPPDWATCRWRGEMVKAVIIPTRLFLTNRKGFPVLTRAQQKFVQSFFTISCIQVVVSGACRHNEKTLAAYHQYIMHLFANREPLSLYAAHGKEFADTLQDPLQPLADNLQSATYAVFEMDPYKYRAYQVAIREALHDRIKSGTGGSDGIQTVMVLGAGRGPLVACTLAAGQELGLLTEGSPPKLRVYAVEKNANAVVTLRNRVLEEWSKLLDVQVLSGDMRQLELPEKADIFVSELLGSFGDNELSPECLDGAMRFLRPDGISIPCEYTSYLAPLQSAKVHSEIRNNRDPEKPAHTAFETTFVVNLVMCDVLAEPQPLFTFTHPNWDPQPDNSRFGQLTFQVNHDSTLHGFVGYFDSILYKNIRMSIVPATHSPDMFSWFPLVFPLTNPVRLVGEGNGRTVTVSMWRRCRPSSVWYEWSLERPACQAIHNPAGRSYTIGL